MADVYRKLRKHLDDLPGGFPATETGVELRILKRKPEAEQFKVPRDLAASLLAHGRARGKLGLMEIVKMQARSKWDRLRASR